MAALAAISQASSAAADIVADPVAGASLVAQDLFPATVAKGLAPASLGGAWTLAGDSADHLSTGNGYATVHDLPGGRSVAAYLPATAGRDTEAKATFTLSQATTSARAFIIGVDARHQSDGSAYRGKISFASATGRPILSVVKVSSGVEKAVAFAGLPWTQVAGGEMNLELQVTGAGPADVAVRAWRAGDSVPGWQASYVDAAPLGAGGVGLHVYRSPVATIDGMSFASFQAWSLPAPAAPVTGTPGPSSSAPTPTPTPTPTPQPLPTQQPPGSTSAVPVISSTTVATGAGSAPVGSTQYAVPAGATFVAPNGSDSASGTLTSPLRTVAAAITKAASGTAIVLRAGSYHESVTVTKAGQKIQAYPGEAVWFDGSTAVTSWTKVGTRWVHYGWTATFDHSTGFNVGANDPSFVNSAYPMAAWPDQVFLDGRSLAQVSSASPVGAGQFAVDYTAKTITIGSDPTGHHLRASDKATAVTFTADHDTLQGVGVRRYATPISSIGAVRVWGAYGAVRNVYMTDIASDCLTLDKAHGVAAHVTTTRCGLEGIHGNQADGLVIDGALVTYNNSEHFNHAPSAAGIKICRTLGMTVKNSDVSNQYDAAGIWLDESVRQFALTNNRAVGDRNGIHVEISDTGVIANNAIDGGEYGIWVHNTGNVKIYNNALTNIWGRAIAMYQDSRRQATFRRGRDPRMPVPDPTCPWIVNNVMIANNTFTNSGKFQLWAMDTQSHLAADDMHITFQGNLFAYKSASTDPTLILWGAGDNVSKTLYQTPAAFNAAKGVSWRNMQTTTGAVSASLVGPYPVSTVYTVALPADVATAIGQPAGTQHLGTF